MLHVQYELERISWARQYMLKTNGVIADPRKEHCSYTRCFLDTNTVMWTFFIGFPNESGKMRRWYLSIKPCQCAYAYIYQSKESAPQVEQCLFYGANACALLNDCFARNRAVRPLGLSGTISWFPFRIFVGSTLLYKQVSHVKRTPCSNHI